MKNLKKSKLSVKIMKNWKKQQSHIAQFKKNLTF